MFAEKKLEPLQPTPIILSLKELRKRYDLGDDPGILPEKYKDLRVGEYHEIPEDLVGYAYHHREYRPLVEADSAIDFTGKRSMPHGQWLYRGIHEIPRGSWFRKDGEKVSGVGTKVAIFSRKPPRGSVAFLVED